MSPLPPCAIALAASIAGCASARAARVESPAVHGVAPLEGDPPPRWINQRITEASRAVFASLSTNGPAGLQSLRLCIEDCARLLNEAGRARAEGTVAGHGPREHEPRWSTMRALAASPVIGWCARGVRLAEPGGPEGFAERALMVDRLLVVGREETGLWGVWVQGLVLTSVGWRLLPWVTWSEAVERPRRDHTDVVLWDCDRASAPMVSQSATPAR